MTRETIEADVAAGIRFAAIKFDKASQAYPLNGADTTVVIQCDKAKVIFGAASLM
ncbi:hypothetical protein [Mycobacteroides abscessus]|uniref:hypothetical protein n=1 Tax=Mycobacteroides abscessus TaxID=36809 RepID=UPI0013F689F4|nr:hypothetical protein [Mycobacteroides abscessus]